jgi:acyl-CoA synthetase (AMP-forming)/AMP-acid ligase II
VPNPISRAAPSADELAAWLEQRLARFKVPRRFVLVDDLPRTAYGKVRKGELREAYLAVGGER